MNKALKLARENGYKLPDPCDYEGIKLYHKAETFTDPLFWQALGKALAWRKPIIQGLHIEEPVWITKAHQWLEAHFESQEAEDQFWKDLLQTKS